MLDFYLHVEWRSPGQGNGDGVLVLLLLCAVLEYLARLRESGSRFCVDALLHR